MKTWLPAFATCLALASTAFCAPSPNFALRDKDVVVFFGDSITAARTYGKFIEEYTLLRFPERKIRFINAGHGGDTAERGLARMERDVFAHGATVVIVAFGINDIGWGTQADEAHKHAHLEAIRGIVEKCRAHGTRAFICGAAITAEDPRTAENGFLQKMCDEALALARSLGAGTIDLQRGMREIQKRVVAANEKQTDEKKKTALHAADTVHLNDVGQIAMGFVILKGLGAPADVSSAVVDARKPELVETHGCKVTGVKGGGDAIEFTRLDEGLPVNLGTFGMLYLGPIPIAGELNRYVLAVKNLPQGRYEIRAGDRLVMTATAGQLASGLNIASVRSSPWDPGGPWDAQAAALKMLTDARDGMDLADRSDEAYLTSNPNLEKLRAQSSDINARVETLQRELARPVPYHFIIRRAQEKTGKDAR